MMREGGGWGGGAAGLGIKDEGLVNVFQILLDCFLKVMCPYCGFNVTLSSPTAQP